MSNTLKITHNAGFFSCCTIRLIEIMKYFNEYKKLPEIVDSSEQFAFYKEHLSDNIVPKFFDESTKPLEFERPMVLSNEPCEVSFGDYSKLHFKDVNEFIIRYFTPSLKVIGIINDYIHNYNINLTNTCAVFFRGNDKQKECTVTPYDDFIEKAREILRANPTIQFLVQPDETEFLEAFTAAFPNNCFWFKETPHMRKKNSAIFYELPPNKKTEHGCNFLAAVIVMSMCKHMILHSGNGGLFAALYRGNMDNVHQFLTNHIY